MQSFSLLRYLGEYVMDWWSPQRHPEALGFGIAIPKRIKLKIKLIKLKGLNAFRLPHTKIIIKTSLIGKNKDTYVPNKKQTMHLKSL